MANFNKKISETSVRVGPVRFCYAHVFAPKKNDDGTNGKYGVQLLIPKTDKAALTLIENAINAAKQAGVSSKWNGKKPANLRLPLRDGDEDRPEAPEYAGMYFLNANSTQKPGIVDKDLVEIIDPEEVYSGCYGRASINFYAFNTNGNRGVGVGLNNIQKLSDGDHLGASRASAESDFGGEDFTDEEDF